MRILKLALGAIGALIALCIVGSIIGSRDRADEQENVRVATERKAADDRAKLDKAVSAFATNLSGNQLVSTCVQAANGGGIPAGETKRCADAVLAGAQAALAAKRPAEAIPLFEIAAKLLPKQPEAQAGLSEAKLMVATESAASELKRAETAWAAKDFPKAFGPANAAKRAVDEGLKVEPDDSTLKALVAKIDPLLHKAQDWTKAEKLVKDSGGYDFEFTNGALVVFANHATDGPFGDILVSGHLVLKALAKGFADIDGLQSITVIESHSYDDARGNRADAKKVAELKVTRKNAATIGWDTISPQNLYKALDKKWVDPRVHIEDAL